MSASAPAKRRRTTHRAPSRNVDVHNLTDWLRSGHLQHIDRIFVIRTSSSDKRGFRAMFETGVALMPNDPDVRVLGDIGHRIVLDEGASDRRRLGAMELRRGSVPQGHGTALLGWLVPIGRTLFVLFLQTARKADLPGPTHDQRRNAFTEAMCEIVRRLQPKALHTPMLNRLVRNVRFGQQLMDCLRDWKVDVWVNGVQAPIAGDVGELSSFVSSFFAARDADQTIARLTGIEALIYDEGQWYTTTRFLTFTWRPRTEYREDPITRERQPHVDNPRDLEVVPGSVPLFDRFVELASTRGMTRRQIGEELGRLGVRSRAPKDFGEPVTLDQLANPANAVSTLLQRRWLDAWHTGTYRTSVRLKADISASHPGLAEDISEIETKGGETIYALDVEIPLPMPDRGWWLDDATYRRLLELHHSSTPQKTGRAASRGTRRPLSSLSQWDDPQTGRQHRLGTFDSSDTYSCLWRPIETAYDEHGATLGWEKPHKLNKLASVNARELHQSIARELLRLAEDLEDQTVALWRPTPAPEAAPDARARREVDRCNQAVERAEARLRGIRTERQIARGDGRLDELALLDKDEREARAEQAAAIQARDAAIAAADALAEDPGEPTEQLVDADLGSLEVIATALMQCDGHAPAALGDALARLMPNTLRVYPAATGLTVTWEAEAELPLRDGTIARRRIASAEPVRGIAFTVHGGGGPDWDERLAEEYFDLGTDLVEVCRSRGVNDSGKADSYPIKRLRHWLREHGVNSEGLRRAALDAPPEARRALARALRDEPQNPYEVLLGQVYRSNAPWGVCWAASTHDTYRAVLAALLEIDPDGANPVEVAEHAHVRWRDLVDLTGSQIIGRPRSGPITRGPALHRNWTRGNGDKHDRTLSVMRCPHSDCLGLVSQGQPGILIQLLVPELGPDALICRSCRRRPDRPDVVFPGTYLDAWRGGRRRGITSSAGHGMLGSQLGTWPSGWIVCAA